MLAAYYEVRGWDPVTGFPCRKKLFDLGMEWVVNDLEPLMKTGESEQL
jgi:aldehyde:ferredoxin oxidoreductase